MTIKPVSLLANTVHSTGHALQSTTDGILRRIERLFVGPGRLDAWPDGETLDASLGTRRGPISAITFELFFFRDVLPACFPWGLGVEAHLNSQHAHPMLGLIVFG